MRRWPKAGGPGSEPGPGPGACAGLACFAALAVAASPGKALAADDGFPRTRNVAVGERPLPGYEALGFHTGAFFIYPRLNLGVDYDSNIYATQTDAISDVIYGVSPEIEVHSDWSRHSVALTASSNLMRYADQTSQNTNDWKIRARGKLDINRQLNTILQLDQQRQTEPRSSSSYDAADFKNPIEYDLSAATLSAAWQRDPWHFSGHVKTVRWRYDDVKLDGGGKADESFRDRTDTEAGLRVDYALSPSLAVFTEGTLTRTRYRLDEFGDRDADQQSILAGVDMELTNLLTGEVSVGHLTYNFDNPASRNISDEHYRVRLRWFPTQLITVTFTGNQQVTDSGLVDDAAVINRDAGVQADYELLRNLIINASTKYTEGRYQGIDRLDQTVTSGLGLNYLMNRNIGVNLHYAHTEQDSSGVARGREFKDDAVGLSLVLQH